MAVKISVKPTMKEVRAEFKARQEGFRNVRPAHVKVSIFLDQWVQRNFKNQGSELGSDKWPPFQQGGRVQNNRILREKSAIAGTRAALRKKKETTLEQKTAAFNAASSAVFDKFNIGSLGGIIDTSAKLLQDTARLKFSFLPFATQRNAGIGSELKYSKPHNEGLGVPKRRILPEPLEVQERIRKILTQHGRDTMKIHGQGN